MTVVAAHFLALLSPGPDFMLIVKSGMKNRRYDALGLALGIASANGVYISLCTAGLGSILTQSILLLRILKTSGGLFLLYMAIKALKTRKKDYPHLVETEGFSDITSRFSEEFSTGFLSGISNPKNLLFYFSLFAIVLTEGTGLLLRIGLGIWMTALVFLWDCLILLVLTQKHVQRVFVGVIFYVDKSAGAVIGFLGIKLILSAINDSSL
jgi:threonine/homoserine/homoserine lactone efflux protein